jgi:SAM-dependent methyltransferase
MKVKPPESNVEWAAWAQKDPLYAVATAPERHKEGAAPWSDEEFYALGKADWQDFRARWEQYGLDRDSCVEIGCGAGRMTRQIASHFGIVHALDISEEMLDYARRNVKAGNVQFRRNSGADLPAFDCTISAVFSCHVFQHFDSLEVARHYFLETHRVLSEGGTLMIHLPIYRWPYDSAAFDWLHRWQTRIDDWKAMLNRRLIRAGIFRPLMCVLAYPIDWIFQELPRMGFEQVEIDIIPLTRNGDPHAFVLARKGDAEIKMKPQAARGRLLGRGVPPSRAASM